MKSNHVHNFTARRPDSTVATCSCGAFKYTQHGLNTLPIVTAQEAPPHRTRAERKAARREYEKAHPILSGAVRIVDYVPPRWNYTPATSH